MSSDQTREPPSIIDLALNVEANALLCRIAEIGREVPASEPILLSAAASLATNRLVTQGYLETVRSRGGSVIGYRIPMPVALQMGAALRYGCTPTEQRQAPQWLQDLMPEPHTSTPSRSFKSMTELRRERDEAKADARRWHGEWTDTLAVVYRLERERDELMLRVGQSQEATAEVARISAVIERERDEAITRAEKAEAEVDRLRTVVADLLKDVEQTIAWRATTGMKPATDTSVFAACPPSALVAIRKALAPLLDGEVER